MEKRNYGVIPSRDVRRNVARLIRAHGMRVAAQRLQIGERSLVRMRDGRAVLPATLAIATSNLAALAAETPR